MLPTYRVLRAALAGVIKNKDQQGHEVGGLAEQLERLPDSYDALSEFSHRLVNLPLREDWPYVEPSDLDAIRAESDPSRPIELGSLTPEQAAARVETAFLSSLCGCVLGKPIEEFPFATMDDIRAALEKTGEWPLNDYISEKMLDVYGRRNISWTETVRERIAFVAPDDDITYTIMGMLLLENHGTAFTKDDIRKLWLDYLPIHQTWGPERGMLLKAGLESTVPDQQHNIETWADILNPGDELCGALIRADAYGYACLGKPELAAGLAWRDASWTHRRTGVYGPMFVAAAIAAAPSARNPLDIFETALKFVPQRSRFYHIVADSLEEIGRATDWIDGYYRIHHKYKEYFACCVYQEVGTLINTLRFAESIGDGICKQVSQGNDTDSFGATSGSILGAYFGPGHLEPRWLEPFGGRIVTSMGTFTEDSIEKLTKRMAALPGLVRAE
ncbi:ADP-ribosylglycohydrolase family protein [Cohnella rhizosphaerae]|uniref:ADP-ribosylglycohydrolase family protein n=1 Tax=Cohnella rhizosphaerae TaxID=1457232 RepID=A0A9X4KY96_9BACL|nr:ADP-ribosylglycohydrolase family protein [Cohnella rhizosphaerae]MDG0813559.1 ADP-ribosylglycohydrolase family protein [Cohnella rhizosphaerae]